MDRCRWHGKRWRLLETRAISSVRTTRLGKPITLADYNRGTWQKLRKEGRRLVDHPLTRRLGWPDRFTGEWERFVDFSRAVDVLSLINERRMISVSRWNSAVINQHFLPYNFRPKTEWPIDLPGGPVRADAPPPQDRRGHIAGGLPAAAEIGLRSGDASISERLVLRRQRPRRLVRRGGAARGRSAARPDAPSGRSRPVHESGGV